MILWRNVIRNELEPKLNKIVNSNDGKWYYRESLSQLTFDIIFKVNLGKMWILRIIDHVNN